MGESAAGTIVELQWDFWSWRSVKNLPHKTGTSSLKLIVNHKKKDECSSRLANPLSQPYDVGKGVTYSTVLLGTLFYWVDFEIVSQKVWSLMIWCQEKLSICICMCVCARACVRARARVCVCVCVCYNSLRIVPSPIFWHGGRRVTKVGSSTGTLHCVYETRDTSLWH